MKKMLLTSNKYLENRKYFIVLFSILILYLCNSSLQIFVNTEALIMDPIFFSTAKRKSIYKIKMPLFIEFLMSDSFH